MVLARTPQQISIHARHKLLAGDTHTWAMTSSPDARLGQPDESGFLLKTRPQVRPATRPTDPLPNG